MQASTSRYKKMPPHPAHNIKDVKVDSELDHHSRKVADRYSETVNIIANEPSVALYRIQEHIRRTLPLLIDQKHEVVDIKNRVQGACFDAEYASKTVKAMSSSSAHFQNIQELLKNAVFVKQQINYKDNKRKQARLNQSAAATSDTDEVTEAGKEGSSRGAAGDNGQCMDSSLDASDCLQKEPVKLLPESLNSSYETREGEFIISRP
ncbi:hypothetical protein BsWGS_00066 [Bradybaena similaris]